MLFWPCTQLHNDNQWSQGHVLVIATQEPHKHNLKFKVHIDRKHLCKRHVKITGIFLILRHFSFFLKKLNRLSCKEKLNIVLQSFEQSGYCAFNYNIGCLLQKTLGLQWGGLNSGKFLLPYIIIKVQRWLQVGQVLHVTHSSDNTVSTANALKVKLCRSSL